MKSIALLKPYIFENRMIIVCGVVCLIAVDMLQLFIPRIVKWSVDDLTSFRATPPLLVKYALYIVAVAIMIGILRYVWRRCLIGTSRRVEEGIRERLFDHIQGLSASYFDGMTTGDLMAHATNDIQHIRMATGMGIVALTDAVVLGTAAIGFMAYINVRLTLFVMIPMPFIVFGTRFFSKKLHGRYLSVQGAFSDLTETVRERFAGIRMIKAHNRERSSVEQVETASRAYVRRNLQLVATTRLLFPMMVLLSNISMVIILYMGGQETIRGVITPGDFVAFISYLGMLTWPMMAIGWVTNLIQRGKASLDRIDRILQVKPDITNPETDGTPTERKAAKINETATSRNGASVQFKDVHFSYPHQPVTSTAEKKKQVVLSGIDFTVVQGTTLGIVGPPGSGKTTLINLIPRIYDTETGSVRLDGMDLRKIDLESLRKRVAFVPQEPFLFAGTIRENITFDNSAVTSDDLETAVRQASLLDTIESLKDGFETVVGEKGVILSGGQKQRVALARAFLKNAPVMILDDPISQVDLETGDTIIRTIQRMAGQRTVIIVSHRLSALKFADRILTLEEGRITESGSHDALMSAGGYYAGTYRLQALEHSYHET